MRTQRYLGILVLSFVKKIPTFAIKLVGIIAKKSSRVHFTDTLL